MRYKILSPIKIDDKIVTKGYAEIPDDEVATLTQLGTIGEVEPAAADVAKQREDTLIAAINSLDKTNVELWLKDGKPDSAVLSKITGLMVTAAERDAAWAIVSAAAV